MEAESEGSLEQSIDLEWTGGHWLRGACFLRSSP
jgi:hypothetical protein